MWKYFHYVFSTYNRAQCFDEKLRSELKHIFVNICDTKGFKVVSQSILSDHVHLLIRKSSFDSNEYVMKTIKGISSRVLFKKYPSDRSVYRKLWARGYRAYEIKDAEQMENTVNYILGQYKDGMDKRFKERGGRDVKSQAIK